MINKILKLQSLCYPPELQESEETLTNIVANNRSYFAYDGDELIGYLLCHYASKPAKLNHYETEGNFLFIHDLAVHPDYRNKNVATRLLKNISEPCMLLSLPEAYRFWRKMGFIETEESLDPAIEESYGYKVILMKKI